MRESRDYSIHIGNICGDIKSYANANPHPLKVIFGDKHAKQKFMGDSQKSKASDFKVQIPPDYSTRQWILNIKLKAKVTKRRQLDSSLTYKKMF